MKKESYVFKNGEWVKATRWMEFKQKIKSLLTRYKLIDTWNNRIVPNDELGRHFIMSEKEYEDAKKIYDEKGTISYEFIPGGGIGWILKIHTADSETIDITDYESW